MLSPSKNVSLIQKIKPWLLIDSAIAGNDKAVEVEETQSNEESSS